VFPPDYFQSFYAYLLVFTSSSLAQRTIPAVLLVSDVHLTVTNLLLVDKDLDATEVGGTPSWTPPAAAASITEYFVYLAENAAGANRQFIDSVAVGTNQAEVPADTALASHTHLLCYIKSATAEQSTPAAFPISDTTSSVSSVAFVDKDRWESLESLV